MRNSTFESFKQNFSDDMCIQQFCRLIQERTGIVILQHQMPNLHSTLNQAISHFKLPDRWQYLERLHQVGLSSEEMEFLIGGITVGESYFFRDDEQIKFLKTIWIPEITQRKRQMDKTLRIWSAGCSMGQEIYTLTIMLRESLPDFDEWNIHCLGTDINTKALTAALKGQYTEWSMRATPISIRDRYFSHADPTYQLDESIRNIVKFTYLNLADDSFPAIFNDTHSMDLILCRNVFIYFDKPTKHAVIEKFSKSLKPGGVLLLGASDYVDAETENLQLVDSNEVFYYQCVSNSTHGHAAITPQSDYELPPVEQQRHQVVEDLKDVQVESESDREVALAEIIKLLRDKNWSAAVDLIDRIIERNGESPDLLLHKASAKANLGKLEEARNLSVNAIEGDKINKHAHFLLGLVCVELHELSLAESSLRRALFLDSRFVEAHYHLGLLLLRQERNTEGLKRLENALAIADGEDPERCLHGAPDMNYRRLGEILRHEIDMYHGLR